MNWTIPISLGKLSNLEYLYLGYNALEGVISKAHFSNLTKLKVLGLSNTLLVFNINSNWVPHFQLKMIGLRFSQLGPQFPKWLQTQKNLSYLDISNSKISDTLSNFDWIFSSQLLVLNLSHNQINGHVPNLSWEFSFFPEIDLSSNKLEGKIPRFLFKATYLDLSKNMFSKQVRSLCIVTNGNFNLLDLRKQAFKLAFFFFFFFFNFKTTPYFLFVHVLHFHEHKILWYALRCSWLASKQWWDGYLCISFKKI